MTAEDSSGGGGGPRPGTAGATAGRKEDDAVAVRVAVHIRPLVEQELAKGCQEILEVSPGQAQICVGQHTFTYDNVYGSGGGDDAANLYPDCVEPLVEGLFKGYNATVFAYGQTGSGKTYTMGSSWSPDLESQGVIPSVMDEMFTRIEVESNTDFVVKVSFVEIHKEEVRDLLWTNSAAPRPVVTIRELPSGVSLAGACERQVHSREEMSHLLMQGTLMRAVASTNMNNRSSRSHAIFTITLEQRKRHMVRPASAPPAVEYTPGGSALPPACANSDSSEGESTEEEDEEELECAGDDYLIAKMHLVDLAGSERAKRTGAQGARLKEAININKGLLALAKVITALVDNQSHVPYRDSKLTRLLQDSLGGNSRTVMIACVSPADINREESLNTLRYADRARRIKNKPVVNRDPVAAQLAALRQQIAGLRAENTALRTALGGDAAAASVFAAAGRAGQSVASEALQEAYDDLAVRCNALEVHNAKQQMELDTAHAEIQVLRNGMLSAETERDQALLRLEALQQSLAASSDEAVKAALQQDAAAASGRTASTAGDAQPAPESGAAAEEQQQPAGGIVGGLGVVAGLRARVSELEAELRQVRSLQRMTSSVLVRGMSSGGMAFSRASVRGTRARGSSTAGGPAAAGAAALGNRGSSRQGSSPLPHAAAGLGISLEGVSLEEEDVDACSPMTPARQAADELDEPLVELEPDAEVLAQSAAHMVAREAMAMKLAVLARQMEAKQKRLLALQSAADMEGAKSKYMLELQKERDTLAKEKTALLQKLQAVEVAGAEERKRLEQQYRDKLTSVERRLKELAEREKAAKRNAAQLGRVQAVCQQLQADISRMKSARAAVQRRMEAKEKEFREWRLMREREVLQLRRNAQRQSAALQQHQAMHSKQQAVLKRKTEEAEAARRKLRDLLELQARVRRDKRPGQGQGTDERGMAPADLELQPNAAAPLLRTEKARREWVEQELELCSTSWQYQKVLDGELAQRAEATRKLREVQKQLMLLGGLVPPSPVVTAAAAAAAAASRGAGAAAAAAAAAKAALPREEVLQQEAARLQAAIDKHSANVKELQEQWERARADEQSRGAGAADVKRWTGIRNIIEARELLRTLFMCACAQKAQVCESAMDLAKLQETADILQIKLDMSVQQAAEAKRKALEAEATTAAVITTPAHQLALAAAAAAASDSEEDDSSCANDGSLPATAAAAARLRARLAKQESAGRTAAAAAAIAAAAAAGRHDAVGVADLLGSLGGAAAAAGASPGPQAHDGRDDVDIEADNLLHSMGLPPIMEMPTPSDDAFSPAGSAHADARSGRGHFAHNSVGSRSLGRQRYASPSSGSHSSRYQELLRLQMAGKAWRSSPGSPRSASGTLDAPGSSFGGFPPVPGSSSGEPAAVGASKGSSSAFAAAAAAAVPEPAVEAGGAGKRSSLSEGGGSLRSSLAGASSSSRASISLGGANLSAAAGAGSTGTGGIAPANSGGLRRPDRAGSLGLGQAAQDLAAKLDALEVDWKGYKKQSAAAAGSQHPHRRSIPGGGKQGRQSYSSSLPGSPGSSMPGGSFGLSSSRPGSAGKADNTAAAAAGGRRQSLSACNTPHQGMQRGVGFWPHQQGPDAAQLEDEDAAAMHEDSGVAAVAKELNFLDIEPEPSTSPPLGGSTPEPQAAGALGSGGGSSSSSSRRGSVSRVGSASRTASSPHAASRPGSGSRPNSQPTTPKSAGGNSNSRRRRTRRQQQQDGSGSGELQQQLPGSGGGGGSSSSRGKGGQWVARSVDGAMLQQQQQRRRREGVQMLLEDEVAEDDSADDDVDNEDKDPSYDPAVHGTPAAAGRGATRRSGRHAGRNSQRHSRLSAGSSDTGDATGIPVSASARVSGRWGGSYASSRATSASSNSSSHTAAAAAFLAGGRSLAAQVSFNHEKRRGWERPVLEDINQRRASAGLPAVDKLTIQLLKEAMTGQEIDGRIWTAGAKTKDNLIADYRRMLHLNERVDEETDIDRITGAATWSMPSSPTSQPQHSSQDGAATAADGTTSSTAALSSSQRSRMAEGGAAAAAGSGDGGRMRRSSSMGASLAVGSTARRVLSAGSHHSVDSQPGSAPGSSHTSPSPRHSLQGDAALAGNRSALAGNSPLRMLGRSSSASGRYRSPGHSGSGMSSNTSSIAGAAGTANTASMLGAAERQAVALSVDGSLLAGGGAERVLREHSPAGALQQAAQRSTQRSSSQKLKISIPSSRVDGPYSARLPFSSSGGGSNSSEPKSQVPSAERSSSNSRHGQPSWR